MARSTLFRRVALAALVFAFVAGTASIGLALARLSEAIAPLWLANVGILALMVRGAPARRPLILAAALAGFAVSNVLFGYASLTGACLSLCNLIEVVIAWQLLRRTLSRVGDLSVLSDLVRALIAIGLVAPAVSAALATLVLYVSSGADPATVALHWYLADALGMLVFGPLLLTIGGENRLGARGHTIVEGFAIVAFAGAATYVVFLQPRLPLLYVIMPILMLAAFRLRFVGTALAVASIALIAAVLTVSGHGPIAFALPAIPDQIIFLQGFLALSVLTTLPVASVLSARARQAAQIEASERQLRRFVETAPLPMFALGSDGTINFANARWRALAGERAGDWRATVAAGSRSAADAFWEQRQARRDGGEVELALERERGRRGWAIVSLSPQHEVDGSISGWIGAVADIDERHRAAKALAEREHLYRLLADNSNDMIVRISLEGVRRYVSPASLAILGFTPEEMIGETPIATIHPDDRPRVARTCQSLLEGVVDPVCSYRQLGRDGRYVWLEATYRLVRDRSGAPLEFIASVRDVGRRRAAESAAAASAARLEESHRLLTMAEELAGVGHFRYDIASGVLFWSDEVYRIHGRDRDDPPTLTEGLDAYHPDDRARIASYVETALNTGVSWHFKARIIRTDGAVRDVECDGQVENAPDGTILGLFGIFRDITEEVAAETVLVAALDEARQATRAKSDFLATMSHEIRTPMTGVLGMIELLRGDLPAHERDRFLTSLEQSANLLTAVIDDVLDFSKIESGKLALEAIDFDFVVLARTTLDLFHSAASRKGLNLTLDCDATALPVRGDPTRLQQVISNLVSNAIKFTATGGVDLAVACGAEGGLQRLRVEVRDTGIGLGADDAGRLFEPFIQADASTTRSFGGTGLGLAICRRLVTAMGGEIGVRSTPGQGSTFWFDLTLPVGVVDMRPVEAAAVAPARSLTVLVAEDNAVNQALVSALIRRDGHVATCVPNGRLALEAANANHFDVILMDMQMPEMDGLAATRAIRASGGPSADAPILALTADAAPERRRFYNNTGLTDFLTKPIDSQLLSRKLAAIANAEPLGAAAAPPATDAAAGDDLIDRAKLDMLTELLGAAQAEQLLELFVADTRMRPATVAQLVRTRQIAAARSEAHAIKGAALNVGAVRLAEAARAIETCQDLASASALVEALLDAAAATLAALADRAPRAAAG